MPFLPFDLSSRQEPSRLDGIFTDLNSLAEWAENCGIVEELNLNGS
jgi:hypothetical protein